MCLIVFSHLFPPEAIIEGRYPVTRTDAKDFAALQMQIVYGDHDPNKHKAGFFDLKVFLPPAYRKDKTIVADILRDHKKLVGMKEMNAKFRYVQLVRSLKTYGITFFDCKEKGRNNKKPVPVLIGVTRDKILKVDPESMSTEFFFIAHIFNIYCFSHSLSPRRDHQGVDSRANAPLVVRSQHLHARLR